MLLQNHVAIGSTCYCFLTPTTFLIIALLGWSKVNAHYREVRSSSLSPIEQSASSGDLVYHEETKDPIVLKRVVSLASMRTVLPGKPQAKLQAVCTALWEGQRLVVRDHSSSSRTESQC